MDYIEIDGSEGEGGGQVLRTSVALAAVTGRSVRIDNIRARRSNPGLQRQHLVAMQAAAEICGGRLKGAELRSRTLLFEPGKVRPGNYSFSIGSAGSATLVLQTVLPALLLAEAPSQVVITGGTHNPWAPPYDFLERVHLPLVSCMGPRVTPHLHRHGFYPAGGGRCEFTIEPESVVNGLDLLERGAFRAAKVEARVANLPIHIAEREVDLVLQRFAWRHDWGVRRQAAADGPGNVLMIELQFEHATELFTGFGRKGVRAERVAEETADEVQTFLNADVPVGPHLADQLILLLALSAAHPPSTGQAGGSFKTMALTGHTLTQVELIPRFLDVAIEVTTDDATNVRVRPQQAASAEGAV
jgi:RNA 3'-terminal phosphate cyclase (ATP)